MDGVKKLLQLRFAEQAWSASAEVNRLQRNMVLDRKGESALRDFFRHGIHHLRQGSMVHRKVKIAIVASFSAKWDMDV
jgi:hypothetical protein